MTNEERAFFESYVHSREGECVLVKTRVIEHRGKRYYLPRLYWQVSHDRCLLKNEILKHHCGNPKCINLDHITVTDKRSAAPITLLKKRVADLEAELAVLKAAGIRDPKD